MAWLKKIADPRSRPSTTPPPEHAPVERAEISSNDGRAVADLTSLLVGEKVAAAHGSSLRPALVDIEALARTARSLESWRAGQLARVLERFYAVIGRQLARIPEDARGEVAGAVIRSMRALVDDIGEGGANERILPAVLAMTNLLDPASGSDRANDLTARANAAHRALVSLDRELDGRSGSATVFNVFPTIVGEIERAHPDLVLEGDDGRIVREFLLGALPREAIDQALVGRLADGLTEMLARFPKDVGRALDEAKARAWQEMQPLIREGKAQLGAPIAGVGPEGAQREAIDAVVNALNAVLDANPAGPASLVGAVEAMHARLAELARGVTPQQLPAWRSLSDLIHVIAGTPVARPALVHLWETLPRLIESHDAMVALARAARAGDHRGVPRALVEASLILERRAEAPGLFKALDRLQEMPAASSIRAALVLLPRLEREDRASALIGALAKAAPRLGGDERAFEEFAKRFEAISETLIRAYGAEEGASLATTIAMVTRGVLSEEMAERILRACEAVRFRVGAEHVARLLLPDRAGRPGLLDLCEVERFRVNPIDHLDTILNVFREIAAPQRERIDPVILRHALHIAGELGRLDRDPATVMGRICDALRSAVAQPENLSFVPRSGGRNKVAAQAFGEPSVQAFLDLHPELPPEVALFAGTTLSPEQLRWLVEGISSTRSRMHVRVLRDVVFACVESNHLDFVDAVRESPSPASAITSALTFVASEYRQGRVRQIPFERLIEGLGQGRDPVLEIETERSSAILELLEKQKAEGGAINPAGMETLARLGTPVKDLVGFLPAGGQAYGVASERLRDPLLACLKAILDGSWPAIKYGNEVGKRQLAGLTLDQRTLWCTSMVTSLEKEREPSGDLERELVRAVRTLRGLSISIPREARLGGSGLPPLRWDEASLGELQKLRDRYLEELRQAGKGTPAHRALSARIGPVNDNLAAIELFLALRRAFDGEVPKPQVALDALRPLAEVAAGPLRRLGARGSAAALAADVLSFRPEPKSTAPRAGKYAIDEETLDSYLTSFGGSCLNPSTGFNRGGMVELLSGAQYKMGRVIDGDKIEGRAIMRLFRAEVGDYKGHVLWMDTPLDVTNWARSAGEESVQLMYRHGLRKAALMGIPFLFKNDQCVKVAEEQGLEVAKDQPVKLFIDKGNTGLHHNQGLYSNDYFIHWPGYTVGYREADEEKLEYEANYNVDLVMPQRV